MGLKDNLSGKSTDDLDSTRSNSAKSSSSSSSSSGSYKTEERVPFILIYRNEDGVLEHRRQPQDMTLTAIKETAQHSWKLEDPPENWVRYWFDKMAFKSVAHMVSKQLDLDLLDLLSDNPEKAIKAVREAANQAGTTQRDPPMRTCPVCNTELDKVLDEYRHVNNSVVCADHTIAEIEREGVLDHGGDSSNRRWE